MYLTPNKGDSAVTRSYSVSLPFSPVSSLKGLPTTIHDRFELRNEIASPRSVVALARMEGSAIHQKLKSSLWQPYAMTVYDMVDCLTNKPKWGMENYHP